MQLWQIKPRVLDVIAVVLISAYGITEVQAATLAELIMKKAFSKSRNLSALKLGWVMSGMPPALQSDWQKFEKGSNDLTNPYLSVISAAFRELAQSGITSERDIEAVIKAKP